MKKTSHSQRSRKRFDIRKNQLSHFFSLKKKEYLATMPISHTTQHYIIQSVAKSRWSIINISANSEQRNNFESNKMKYLVTAPIDRPQRPIRDVCLLPLKYDTTTLRSSFCCRCKDNLNALREKGEELKFGKMKKAKVPHANQG